MKSRDIVKRTILFEGAPRLPYNLPEPYGTDFAGIGMTPSPDSRPSQGIDEWGAVWENIGVCQLGEVKEFPLQSWENFDHLAIPDITEPHRWSALEGARERAGDKFLIASGISIYERVHFIRGLENTWIDIYQNTEALCELLDILVDMNLYAIHRYADAGADGFMFCDDWGLQDRLMISPQVWRKLWKPRYARIYEAVHNAGMLAFLHSCGHIVSILDDLIEIGLDVIHMDQQENMGLALLGERFGGRLTFYSPVDIQQTMVSGTEHDIRSYCRNMVKLLGRSQGGFIPRWYSDPAGAGHATEAIKVMCQEFIRLSTTPWEAV
ncbi:MAG: uroporphyrinogen decarboxylase family protein [Anaerolineae bacterium]|nr:uroporphyrinogen decarboxylase family protein [Anaerolineae bacterium]